MRPDQRAPLVVVSVGTDHHPFTRLIGWMDEWAVAHPEVRCVIQHGMSPAPTCAEAIGTVPHRELVALLEQASVVVCQAGPGSILDAWRVGLIPLAVPRLPHLGEVVDAHQVAFAEAMRSRGRAIVATSAEQLDLAISKALADPASVSLPTAATAPPAAGTAAHIDEVLTKVTAERSHWLNWSRVRDLMHPRSPR